jgi:hypothetical protein
VNENHVVVKNEAINHGESEYDEKNYVNTNDSIRSRKALIINEKFKIVSIGPIL